MAVEINGRPARAEELTSPGLANHAHYAVMEVEDGHVRGLDRDRVRSVAATDQAAFTVDPEPLSLLQACHESTPPEPL